MVAAFEAEYARRFSFLMPDKTIIAEAVSVEVTGAQEDLGSAPPIQAPAHGAARIRMFTAGAWAEVDLFPRATLRSGQAVNSPAIIAEDLATTVVEPGWQAVVTDR